MGVATIIENTQTTAVGMDFIGCDFILEVSIEECHNLDQLVASEGSSSNGSGSNIIANRFKHLFILINSY